MTFAPRVSRVVADLRERPRASSSASSRAASTPPAAPPRWRPWLESTAPVSWSDARPRGEAAPDTARWTFGDRVISADFDGGNLLRVERARDDSFRLWTRADCQGTPHQSHHRTWFHFRVEGVRKGETVTFTFPDFNAQKTLFGHDYRPVYRAEGEDAEYRRVKTPTTHKAADQTTGGVRSAGDEGDGGAAGCVAGGIVVAAAGSNPGTAAGTTTYKSAASFRWSFKHRFDTDPSQGATYFAFTHPFGYHDNERMLRRVDARFAERGLASVSSVLYRRDRLATSLEGREVDVLTITSRAGDVRAREVFVVSAGVHPGEKPGNHMMCGMLEFLLRGDDRRAARLRERYVFKLVPMLNPDGAFRGHFRNDTLGQNLNRCYESPCEKTQPAIAAVRALLTRHARRAKTRDAERDTRAERVPDEKRFPGAVDVPTRAVASDAFEAIVDALPLGFYLDLHGHVNKRGVFAFGNAHEDEREAAESRAWAKLVSLNSPHFDLGQCNFTEKNMRARDKNGTTSKEGSGRVALYRETGFGHAYVVEANYVTGRLLGRTAECAREEEAEDPGSRGGGGGRPSSRSPDARPVTPPCKSSRPVKYDPDVWRGVGRALLIAALDLKGANPWSRVPGSELRTLEGVRKWARAAALGGRKLEREEEGGEGGGLGEPRVEVRVGKKWRDGARQNLAERLGGLVT